MDARKGNIFEILNGNKQFLIPVYQRYYSWDTDQCRRLWNDIVDMQKKNRVSHFVGSIVNIAEQAMPTGVQKYMSIHIMISIPPGETNYKQEMCLRHKLT